MELCQTGTHTKLKGGVRVHALSHTRAQVSVLIHNTAMLPTPLPHGAATTVSCMVHHHMVLTLTNIPYNHHRYIYIDIYTLH